MANVQENVILHYQTFYFGKTCAETWKFSLPKKLDFRREKTFCNRQLFLLQVHKYVQQN
jgi:hypothetical protein